MTKPNGYHAGLVRAVEVLDAWHRDVVEGDAVRFTVRELAAEAELSDSRAGDIVRALRLHGAVQSARNDRSRGRYDYISPAAAHDLVTQSALRP